MNDHQQKTALASKKRLQQQFPILFTEIIASTQFYPAEEYHQKYYQKNPWRYQYYRHQCGRDQRLKEVWHDEIN